MYFGGLSMMADDPIARLIQRWRNDADYDPDQASAYTWSKCASELEAAVQAALRASPPPDEGIAVLVAFIEKKALAARKSEQQRRDSAATWRAGTDADWNESHRLAEKMEGRRYPKMSASEREQSAQIDDRIASKDAAEADTFEAVAKALRAVRDGRREEPKA